MKKIFFFILSLLTISNLSFSQNTWNWVNPKTSATNLRDGIATPSNHLYICGDGGVVLRSVNNGGSFTSLNVPSNLNYHSIKFINDQTGFVSGYLTNLSPFLNKAMIFKTTDSGNSWALSLEFNDNVKYSIEAKNNILYAYPLHNAVLIKKSTDLGETWFDVNPMGGVPIKKLQFISDSLAYRIAGNTLSKSTNSGVNFSSIYNIGYYDNIFDMHFYNENYGTIIYKNGRIFYTTNGGSSWIDRSLSQTLFLTSVKMTNPLNIFVSSAEGKFLESINGGFTWNTYQHSTFTAGINGLVNVQSSDNFNLLFGQKGFIAKKYLGINQNISKMYPLDNESLICRDIDFLNENTGYVLFNQSRILKTTDGGATFNAIHLNIANNDLWAIKFINDSVGYLGTSFGGIFKTSNGGNSWSIESSSNSYWIIDITTGGDYKYAIGSNGVFLRSHINGSNWSAVSTPVPSGQQIYSVDFLNRDTGFISSYGIHKTTDRGNSWTNISPSTNTLTSFHRVDFINDLTGYAAAEHVPANGGKVYKTINGGSSWFTVLTHNSAIYNVKFVDQQTGYATGSFGHIYKTTNGGSNWSLVFHMNYIDYSGYTIPNEPVTWLKALDAIGNKVLTGGSFGTLLSSSTGGTVGIHNVSTSNEIVSDFVLHQNYPNPFNPSTVINYELRVTNYVKLTIYDILGKEVATLVNGKQNAGKYSVEWNASGFNSGIYFYKLDAQDYSEVKKMILMK